MKIKSKVTEAEIDEEKLARAELVLKVVLPRAYRSFLKQHNGGKPEEATFGFIGQDGNPEESTIHYFFGIHEGSNGNLLKEMRDYKDRIPDGTLPIATDPFGNLILLGIDGGSDPAVYFWDHENEPEGNEIPRNVYLVCNCFTEFINGLRRNYQS